MSDGERRFSRRKFVQVAGVGAGTIAAGSLASARPAGAAGGIGLKVGVLAPTGSSYANMGRSLVDGLTLGFDAERALGVNATLVAPREVDRGFGGALSAAKDLLDGGADVVVAGVSALVAARLAPLFAARQATLVVANVGAHAVPPSAKSAFVVHNSLQYWQSAYVLGRVAALTAGKRAFLASSLCDSGYDTVYAFRRGFESGGGTIVGEAVTHVDPANSGMADLPGAVKSSGAGILCGLYSGAHAVEFAQAGLASGAKVLAGSLAVEDYLLPTVGAAAGGAISCASWTTTSATKANQVFTKAFRSRFGRVADPFAALGYDSAALVAQGARRATQSGLGLRRLAEALAGATVTGPRGTLTIDAATNVVAAPLTLRQVRRMALGSMVNVDIAKAPALTSFPAALGDLASGAHSGYINEYLCA